jgi:hypothetical protein
MHANIVGQLAPGVSAETVGDGQELGVFRLGLELADLLAGEQLLLADAVAKTRVNH